MKKITLTEFKDALKQSWSRGTSYDQENWTLDNPALGNCAVSALAGVFFLGGCLVVYFIKAVGWHYKNQLPGGIEIDFTEEQFTEEPEFLPGKIVDEDGSLKEYLLNQQSTCERFLTLKGRMEEIFDLSERKQ